MKRRFVYILFFLWFLFLTGCQLTGGDVRSDDSLLIMDFTEDDVYTVDEQYEGKIDKIVQDVPEIYDVMVLRGTDDTLITYKVKHLQRFRMKKIEKELKEKLRTAFPDEAFIVSSDFKIFLEGNRLRQKINERTFSRKDAEQRLKEIIELSKEKT